MKGPASLKTAGIATSCFAYFLNTVLYVVFATS